MVTDPNPLDQDQTTREIIEEKGLTAKTEPLIEKYADELVEDIDDFDEGVQMVILENL